MSLQTSRQLFGKTERCQLCGRRSDTDKNIPVVGWTGPECAHKVAALEATLERLDLKRYLDGPVPFNAEPDEDAHSVSRWVFPEHIQAVMRRAKALGFLFQWGWVEYDTGASQCWLRLPHNAERRRKVWARLKREQTAVSA